MGQTTKDPINPYPPLKGNDQGTVLVQLVIDWCRGHRGEFNSTEATNIGAAIVNVLNGTTKI